MIGYNQQLPRQQNRQPNRQQFDRMPSFTFTLDESENNQT